MLLGRNRFTNQSTLGAGDNLGEGTGFLNQNNAMPMGMQRFLAKKGINSSDDFANRMQYGPRIGFRKNR